MHYIWISCVTAFLLISTPVLADDKKQEKKPESKEEDLKGDEKEDSSKQDLENIFKESLKKITDMMKEVESRLNDGDSDDDTQESQRRIVEAMKFGDKARAGLDDLIKKMEDEANKQSSQNQSSDQQMKNQQQQQQQKQLDQNQKLDPKDLEKQKQQESRRQRLQPNKSDDNSKKTPHNSKKDKKEEKSPKEETPKLSDSSSPSKDSRNWGELPPKLHEDAVKARDTKVPERFREQIEKYREAMSK